MLRAAAIGGKMRCCLALLLLGCGAFPTRVAAPPAGPSGPDGNLRLGTEAVPLSYAIDLTIDPAAERVSGITRIVVKLEAPTAELQLHGEALDIQAADAVVGDTEREAAAAPGENGGLALRFADPLPAGEVTLRLVYTAPLPEIPEGLYRVKDGDSWYAFTQFQPLDARKAFPCFDQPEFKTPFAVTLRVPTGQVALANSKETARTTEGELDVFTFAETQPLPTYLVAFAVGPFDVVEAPADAIPDVPLRLVATRGKGRLAGYALARAPVILAALARYFGRPYPYDKLDLVAVPNFAAGAMENVGLVTFRETLVLLDGDTAPARRKMWSQSVIAHELAHMWFGDLVTPRWWDDLWLNEAFATWMAQVIVHQVDPALEANLSAVAGTHWVMSLDAAKHARAVRQPIEHGGDVENAFDGITYGKGAAVLRMLETWLGVEAFQAGVRAHLEAHAHGTAATADLMAALEAASKKPVDSVARTFLDQPGTPLVSVQVACEGEQAATLTATQRRYLPAGSDAPQGTPWKVPVCVRYGIGEAVHRQCFVLDGPAQAVKLAHPGCPAWLHPNADQRGYYQWSVPASALKGLVETHRGALSMVERVALVGQLRALLEAGQLPVSPYLQALAALAEETHRLVLSGITSSLAQLHRVAVDGGLEAPYRAFVRRVLAPHVKRVGLEPAEGEAVDVKLLRTALLGTYAYLTRDEAVLQAARALVDAFLADPGSVAPEVVQLVLPMAAWSGDEALWSALRDAAVAAEDPVQRVALVGALGSFETPELKLRSLELVLDGTLRAQDLRQLMRSGRATREATWTWMTEKYGDILKVMGPSAGPRMPWAGAGFCTAEDREKVASFFADEARRPDGTDRNLGLALEGIDRCVRLRKATRAALESWLEASAK